MTQGDTIRLVHPDAAIIGERIAHVESVARIGDALQVILRTQDNRLMGATFRPGAVVELGEVCQ